MKFKNVKTIKKVWGEEVVITNNNLYCGKLLKFNKGHKSSLHYHKHKTETWLVLNGELELTYYKKKKKKKRILRKMDVVHIKKKNLHKLYALKNSIIVEVSTHHKNSDTFRLKPSK